MNKYAYAKMMGLNEKADKENLDTLLNKAIPWRNMSPIEMREYALPHLKEKNTQMAFKGIPSFSMVDRLSRGKGLQEGEKVAVDINRAYKKNYDSESVWRRMLEWIKEKWAALTGGDTTSTYRGSAIQAGKNAQSILNTIKKFSK